MSERSPGGHVSDRARPLRSLSSVSMSESNSEVRGWREGMSALPSATSDMGSGAASGDGI